MATVWVADDPVLSRRVAVKILRADLAADDGTRARFRHEAIAAARLVAPQHRRHLRHRRRRRHRLHRDGAGRRARRCATSSTSTAACPCADVIRIGKQVADALDAAHRAGLVHRDVKPANVLVPPGGPVKVTDFGIAKAAGADDLTRTGTVMGTARYLAPEQVNGRPDRRAHRRLRARPAPYEMLVRPPAVRRRHRDRHRDGPPHHVGARGPRRAARGVAGARRRDPPLPRPAAVGPVRVRGGGARRPRPRAPRPHRRDPAPGRRPRSAAAAAAPASRRHAAAGSAAPTGPTHPQPVPVPRAAPRAAAPAARRGSGCCSWSCSRSAAASPRSSSVQRQLELGQRRQQRRGAGAAGHERDDHRGDRLRPARATAPKATSSPATPSTATPTTALDHRAVRQLPRRREERRRPRARRSTREYDVTKVIVDTAAGRLGRVDLRERPAGGEASRPSPTGGPARAQRLRPRPNHTRSSSTASRASRCCSGSRSCPPGRTTAARPSTSST